MATPGARFGGTRCPHTRRAIDTDATVISRHHREGGLDDDGDSGVPASTLQLPREEHETLPELSALTGASMNESAVRATQEYLTSAERREDLDTLLGAGPAGMQAAVPRDL